MTQATATNPTSPNEIAFALFMAIVVPLLAMSRSNGYMMLMFKTIPNYFVSSIFFLLLTRAAQRYYTK